jgi:uncharacterized protein with NRDE domain
MCLAVVALDAHPHYTVIVAANRDEFHARPTQPAHWWADDAGAAVLAGRDLEHGGTWLGLSRAGRWAFVTNVREPGRHDPRAPSRGALVPAVLRAAPPVVPSVESVVARAGACNGFNLLAGEGVEAAFGSNRRSLPHSLEAGLHGISNAHLDDPWPKVARVQAGVAAWIESAHRDLHPLFDVLADRAMAADGELPDTGIARERERLLSAPFIVSPEYGTRCSTLVAIARDGDARFIERSFDAKGHVAGDDREFAFSVARAASRDAECPPPRIHRR